MTAVATLPCTWPALPEHAELVVIVLQWGRGEETVRCLQALQASVDLQLVAIVVDNGSPDDSVARVRAAHPLVPVVENGANLGYAEGNNVALRWLLAAWRDGIAPRHCLVLNNDVEVAPTCLARMVACARERQAAAVGALNLVRGAEEVGSSGGFIEWPSGRYRDAGASARALGQAAFEVETLAGSTLLLDLAALAEVGVFDAAYFCVYEETDLCLRLREAGHRLWLVPGAVAHHGVGASTSRQLHFYFRFRNRIRFVRRHGGPHALRRLLPALALELVWRLPAYLVLGRAGDAWGILRGLLDGLRGRGGPGPFLPPPATAAG